MLLEQMVVRTWKIFSITKKYSPESAEPPEKIKQHFIGSRTNYDE